MNGQTIVIVIILLILGVFGYQHLEARNMERMVFLEEQQKRLNRQNEAEQLARQDAEIRARNEELQRQEQERQRVQAAHRDKAFAMTERAKDKIINTVYDGGSNKGVEIREWEYNPGSDSYRMKVALTWNGYFYASRQYAADGYITVDADGGNLNWNPIWVNANLSDYQENKHILGAVLGTVVALGTVSSSGS